MNHPSDKNQAKMANYPFVLTALLFFVTQTFGEPVHQDSRCNCVCPDPSVSRNKTTPANVVDFTEENLVKQGSGPNFDDQRVIYINSTVSPDECNCHNVVLIHLNLTDTEAESFCPRCLCKYQTRSLTVIKVKLLVSTLNSQILREIDFDE